MSGDSPHTLVPPPLSPEVDRLFHACPNWAEPIVAVDEADLDHGFSGDDPQLGLAVCLYRAVAAMQNVQLDEAERQIAFAHTLAASVSNERLQWWYLYSRAFVDMLRGRLTEGSTGFLQAADTARAVEGMELQWERSFANHMLVLRWLGEGQAASDAFLRYLQTKPNTASDPLFHQVAADVLHWLGESDLAYQLRFRGQRTTDPIGKQSRDHRELARCALVLGRLELAAEHIGAAFRLSSERATPEELSMHHEVAAALEAERGDRESALEHLALARSFYEGERDDSRQADSAFAACAVAELLLRQGDPEAAHRVLLPQTGGMEGGRLLELRAAIAQEKQDWGECFRLLRKASELEERRWPSAGSVSRIRAELDPWLGDSDPIDAHLASNIAQRQTFRTRLMSSTARDIRRCMAPAFLALEGPDWPDLQARVLPEALDELRLIAEFLADSRSSPPTQEPTAFWRNFATLESIANRRGALLTLPDVGENKLQLPALAGRLATGLVALCLDHSEAGAALTLHVTPHRLRLQGRDLGADAARRILADLAELRSQTPDPGSPVPRRASFISTLDVASAKAWRIEAKSKAAGKIDLTVFMPDQSAGAGAIGKQSDAAEAAPAPMAPPIPDDYADVPEHADIMRGLVSLHENRFSGAPPDLAGLERARASGNRSLLASALLVNAGAAILSADMPTGARLVEELQQLLIDEPSLQASIWPGESVLSNRATLVYESTGQIALAAEHSASEALHHGESGDYLDPRWAITLYNYGQKELDRGALANSWRLAEMVAAGALNSMIRHGQAAAIKGQLLLAEHQPQAAAAVTAATIEQVRGSDSFLLQDALMHQLIATSRTGEFERAEAALTDLKSIDSYQTGSHHRVAALEAVLAFARQDWPRAWAAIQDARSSADPRFNARALTLVVPIEADLLLAEGHPEQAQAVLDSFEETKHRYLDLDHRLDVAARVAQALGDNERRAAALRSQLKLKRGQPRFSIENLPKQLQLWKAIGRYSKSEVARIERERAHAGRTVAHDLNNAITVCEFALGLPAAPDQPAVTDVIATAMRTPLTLADQLDAVALAGAPYQGAIPEPVNLGELMDSVCQAMEAEAKATGRTLEFVNLLDANFSLRTIQPTAELVLNNLIGNALKHGKPDGTVRVCAEYHPVPPGAFRSTATISIADDGPGFGDDPYAHFGEFVRGENSPGLGLGLWIVRRYCHDLGFELEPGVSEALGGAEVVITIPIGVALAEASSQDSTGSHRRSELPQAELPQAELPQGEQPQEEQRVTLVVEDDAMLRELLVATVRKLGHRVDSATTLTEALARFDEGPIDVVLSDVDLADGSTGYDVYAGATALPKMPRFILMSGHGAGQIRAEARRRFEATPEILAKPFTLAALEDILNEERFGR